MLFCAPIYWHSSIFSLPFSAVSLLCLRDSARAPTHPHTYMYVGVYLFIFIHKSTRRKTCIKTTVFVIYSTLQQHMLSVYMPNAAQVAMSQWLTQTVIHGAFNFYGLLKKRLLRPCNRGVSVVKNVYVYRVITLRNDCIFSFLW